MFELINNLRCRCSDEEYDKILQQENILKVM